MIGRFCRGEGSRLFIPDTRIDNQHTGCQTQHYTQQHTTIIHAHTQRSTNIERSFKWKETDMHIEAVYFKCSNIYGAKGRPVVTKLSSNTQMYTYGYE